MLLLLVSICVFYEPSQVSFFDAGVNGSNLAHVVIPHKNCIHKYDDGHFAHYYIHHHQIDHNLVLESSREFTFIKPK